MENRSVLALTPFLLFFLGLLAILFAGCGRENESFPPEAAFIQPKSSYSASAEEGYPMKGDHGEVLLTVEEVEPVCNRFIAEIPFQVSAEQPRVFRLSTVSGTEYCVEVQRQSGYVTLSHVEGTVTRQGNLFKWCVRRESAEVPTEVIVRSLTPSAEFLLRLRRQ